jgi:hypothetical protein
MSVGWHFRSAVPAEPHVRRPLWAATAGAWALRYGTRARGERQCDGAGAPTQSIDEGRRRAGSDEQIMVTGSEAVYMVGAAELGVGAVRVSLGGLGSD